MSNEYKSSRKRTDRARRPVVILMADDDLDDCQMAREAMAESRVVNEMRFVHNGEELLDYLYQRGKYSEPGSAPRPGLILLDLNMPLMDGREALEKIKSDPDLRRMPVVFLRPHMPKKISSAPMRRV